MANKRLLCHVNRLTMPHFQIVSGSKNANNLALKLLSRADLSWDDLSDLRLGENGCRPPVPAARWRAARQQTSAPPLGWHLLGVAEHAVRCSPALT